VFRRFCWLVVVALLIAGCGGDDQGMSESEFDDLASEHLAELDSGSVEDPGLGPIGGSEWPSGIPEDIPELEGEITNIMSGESHTRLFYQGVSDSDLLEYLNQLEGSGWALEFIVYEDPTDVGGAEERAAAGEWDAVRAAKGDYRLGLEFGGGTGIMDIEGLPEGTFGPDTSWPAEWVGLPAPSQLEINEVTRFGDPMVEVTYETDDDVFTYSDELEAVGFTVINRSFDQNDDLISIALRSDQHEVTLRTYPGQRLMITRIDPEDSLLTPPPSVSGDGGDDGFAVETNEFPDWLPEVPGGDIVFATEDPGGGFTASVTIAEGHTVAEYVEVLTGAGYAVSGEMLMGHVLSDGERTITIYGDDNGLSPLQILIQVTAP